MVSALARVPAISALGTAAVRPPDCSGLRRSATAGGFLRGASPSRSPQGGPPCRPSLTTRNFADRDEGRRSRTMLARRQWHLRRRRLAGRAKHGPARSPLAPPAPPSLIARRGRRPRVLSPTGGGKCRRRFRERRSATAGLLSVMAVLRTAGDNRGGPALHTSRKGGCSPPKNPSILRVAMRGGDRAPCLRAAKGICVGGGLPGAPSTVPLDLR